MSLVTTLFRSRRLNGAWKDPSSTTVYEGPVADLVRQLESAAQARGLTVSRWQTNSRANSRISTVTWAIHRGQRAAASGQQQDVIAMVQLNSVEGKTERSEAYRKLHRMLAAMGE